MICDVPAPAVFSGHPPSDPPTSAMQAVGRRLGFQPLGPAVSPGKYVITAASGLLSSLQPLAPAVQAPTAGTKHWQVCTQHADSAASDNPPPAPRTATKRARLSDAVTTAHQQRQQREGPGSSERPPHTSKRAQRAPTQPAPVSSSKRVPRRKPTRTPLQQQRRERDLGKVSGSLDELMLLAQVAEDMGQHPSIAAAESDMHSQGGGTADAAEGSPEQQAAETSSDASTIDLGICSAADAAAAAAGKQLQEQCMEGTQQADHRPQPAREQEADSSTVAAAAAAAAAVQLSTAGAHARRRRRLATAAAAAAAAAGGGTPGGAGSQQQQHQHQQQDGSPAAHLIPDNQVNTAAEHALQCTEVLQDLADPDFCDWGLLPDIRAACQQVLQQRLGLTPDRVLSARQEQQLLQPWQAAAAAAAVPGAAAAAAAHRAQPTPATGQSRSDRVHSPAAAALSPPQGREGQGAPAGGPAIGDQVVSPRNHGLVTPGVTTGATKGSAVAHTLGVAAASPQAISFTVRPLKRHLSDSALQLSKSALLLLRRRRLQQQQRAAKHHQQEQLQQQATAAAHGSAHGQLSEQHAEQDLPLQPQHNKLKSNTNQTNTNQHIRHLANAVPGASSRPQQGLQHHSNSTTTSTAGAAGVGAAGPTGPLPSTTPSAERGMLIPAAGPAGHLMPPAAKATATPGSPPATAAAATEGHLAHAAAVRAPIHYPQHLLGGAAGGARAIASSAHQLPMPTGLSAPFSTAAAAPTAAAPLPTAAAGHSGQPVVPLSAAGAASLLQLRRRILQLQLQLYRQAPTSNPSSSNGILPHRSGVDHRPQDGQQPLLQLYPPQPHGYKQQQSYSSKAAVAMLQPQQAVGALATSNAAAAAGSGGVPASASGILSTGSLLVGATSRAADALMQLSVSEELKALHLPDQLLGAAASQTTQAGAPVRRAYTTGTTSQQQQQQQCHQQQHQLQLPLFKLPTLPANSWNQLDARSWAHSNSLDHSSVSGVAPRVTPGDSHPWQASADSAVVPISSAAAGLRVGGLAGKKPIGRTVSDMTHAARRYVLQHAAQQYHDSCAGGLEVVPVLEHGSRRSSGFSGISGAGGSGGSTGQHWRGPPSESDLARHSEAAVQGGDQHNEDSSGVQPSEEDYAGNPTSAQLSIWEAAGSTVLHDYLSRRLRQLVGNADSAAVTAAHQRQQLLQLQQSPYAKCTDAEAPQYLPQRPASHFKSAAAAAAPGSGVGGAAHVPAARAAQAPTATRAVYAEQQQMMHLPRSDVVAARGVLGTHHMQHAAAQVLHAAGAGSWLQLGWGSGLGSAAAAPLPLLDPADGVQAGGLHGIPGYSGAAAYQLYGGSATPPPPRDANTSSRLAGTYHSHTSWQPAESAYSSWQLGRTMYCADVGGRSSSGRDGVGPASLRLAAHLAGSL